MILSQVLIEVSAHALRLLHLFVDILGHAEVDIVLAAVGINMELIRLLEFHAFNPAALGH